MRPLNSLNYQHLLYFWTVAREGSIAKATGQLNLTQPTISAQLRALERALGERLLVRRGRGLQLTEVGRTVFRYADEMFGVARELVGTLDGAASGRPLRFTVGISDALPKLTTIRLLEPAFAMGDRLRVTLRIDKTDRLLGDLSIHGVDLVIADAPVPSWMPVRLFNHLLGECDVTVFGTPALARAHTKRFPRSLDGAPFIVQTPNTALRRSLDEHLAREGIAPRVVCEVEDVALAQELGGEGKGLFAAPSVVEAQIRARYGVVPVGRLPKVRERFFAISAERRIKHPAVLAISDAARDHLFG
ncbi:MAG: LysR family transcriptional regulator [Gemmatimonadaceae bacterium]